MPNVYICMLFVISLFGYLTSFSVLLIVIGSHVQTTQRLQTQVRELKEINEILEG